MANITSDIKDRLGLIQPNIPAIRGGDLTAAGTLGHNRCGGFSHQQGLVDRQQAAAIFAALTPESKAKPGNVTTALGIAKVALFAERNIPDGVATFLAAQHVPVPRQDKFQDYITIGGLILKTKKEGNNFMLFLDNNMDPNVRVFSWELTGREQHEWYKAFQRAGKATVRVADTVGLRGTDLTRLTTAAEVNAAVRFSPTLARRRPDNHAVSANDWPQVQRMLHALLAL